LSLGSAPHGQFEMAMGPAGELLVGWISSYSMQGPGSLHLARFTAGGALDYGFGYGGESTLPYEVSGNSFELAIDGQGRTLAGFTGTQSGTGLSVVRLNADGSMDASFSGDGLASAPVRVAGTSFGSVHAAANGEVVLTGLNPLDMQVVAVTFNADGTLDAGFGDAEPPAIISGDLTATDPDGDGASLLQWTGGSVGAYGAFAIDPAGHWTFDLDESSPSFLSLEPGQQATESYPVSVSDEFGAWTAGEVVITVVGAA
jgi:uncharacterized delta-60 repeat protein